MRISDWSSDVCSSDLIENEKTELEARVADRVRDAERAQAEILERLAIASDYRDDETGDHTRRVGDLSGRLANRLGPDPECSEECRVGTGWVSPRRPRW